MEFRIHNVELKLSFEELASLRFVVISYLVSRKTILANNLFRDYIEANKELLDFIKHGDSLVTEPMYEKIIEEVLTVYENKNDSNK